MHPDCRGCKGVGGWEEKGAPILPVLIWSFGWAGDDVMPP